MTDITKKKKRYSREERFKSTAETDDERRRQAIVDYIKRQQDRLMIAAIRARHCQNVPRTRRKKRAKFRQSDSGNVL